MVKLRNVLLESVRDSAQFGTLTDSACQVLDPQLVLDDLLGLDAFDNLLLFLLDGALDLPDIGQLSVYLLLLSTCPGFQLSSSSVLVPGTDLNHRQLSHWFDLPIDGPDLLVVDDSISDLIEVTLSWVIRVP